MFDIDFASWALGVCCGIIVMGIISDKANRAQIKEIQDKAKEDFLGYCQIIAALEWERNALKERLARLNEKLKKK